MKCSNMIEPFFRDVLKCTFKGISQIPRQRKSVFQVKVRDDFAPRESRSPQRRNLIEVIADERSNALIKDVGDMDIRERFSHILERPPVTMSQIFVLATRSRHIGKSVSDL